MSQFRQLAAIMFTDIVGYTALMGRDEQKAFELLDKNRQIHKLFIEQYNGKWIKELGDGVMASFNTVSDAVNAAIEIQNACTASKALSLRIGIHEGEIIFENNDIYGDAVNIASRIQTLGVPGSILFSKKINDEIKNKTEFKTVSLGNFDFKNVNESIEVFALANDGFPIPKRSRMEGKLTKRTLLKRNVILALSFVTIGLAAFFIYTNFFAKNDNGEVIEKSIAVLPFVNMSNDPQQEYFSDGMTDEIINHLYKIGDLRVISRTTSMTYKGSKKTSKEIANELGVANLLGGSVLRDGDRIRIIVQLIDGKTDQNLWAETYPRDLRDVFAIQSDIAREIAIALQIKIDPTVEKRIEFRPTANTEAYNLYLKAISSEGLYKRKDLLEKAIALDSNFADAYSELAIWWCHAGGHGGNVRSEEVLKKAPPLLHKALQLNPDLAMAHRNTALFNLWYKWDFKAVEKGYQKVIELNPSNTETFAGFTDFLLATERFEEALKVTKNALINNRNSDLLWGDLAVTYYFNNNPKKAIETIETALSLFPENGYIILNSIRVKVFMNKYEEAIDTYEKYFAALKDVAPIFLAYTAIAYFKTSQQSKGEDLLTRLKARSRQSSVGSPSFFIAGVYASLGQSDLAIEWLEKAHDTHEVEMYWLKVEPPLKPLHNDERFQSIVNRIGYPK
jgi:TolB-like protein/class 3 adenylate cyclase